jgi:hypothetical protein
VQLVRVWAQELVQEGELEQKGLQVREKQAPLGLSVLGHS